MSWTSLLLVLLSHCTVSLFQPVVTHTQPPSLSTSPGTSGRLTCTLSSDISVDSKDTFWYQQKPGTPPQCLLYYHTDSDKHQDASANAGLLLISGQQPEDEADCYCETVHSSASHSDTGRWEIGAEPQSAQALGIGASAILQ
uniref:Ig-like domain-containing protein n=1 Tax=Equus asinus TaxID=9793 RepID=A0A9L0J1N4_EQUAS